MKKKINITLSLLLFLVLYSKTFSQGPGEPYFPETANGAKNINHQNHSLRWQNPSGTVYNEVYIHYDSSKVANMDQSALFISGYPSVAYDSIRINQQLYFYTRYFWCVVEYSSNGSTRGDVWHFSTTWMNTDYYLLDDFSFGLGKWNINNVGGCGWQIGESVNYTLPPPSTSKLLSADKSLCGNTINATATFQQVNIMKYMSFARLEFNSDWKSETQNDVAKVEMTTNDGFTWSTIWEKTGVSDRNSHIDIILFNGNGNPDTIYNVQIRFKTLQYGTDSWWAIDNVVISGMSYLLTHGHPGIINVNANYSILPRVILNFGCALPGIVRIERKTGIPTDPGNYQILDSFYSTYYNTYIDSTIVDSATYTYRVGIRENWSGNYWYTYSTEATAYVFPIIPVELIDFNAEIIENEVRIIWSTATETNNQGFEILRFTQNDTNGWEKISFVTGFGTTTEVHHYTFLDESVQSGTYQYRLKQIDFDGSFEYSNIIEVNVDAPIAFSLEQNYPNPFNPVTSIKYVVGSQSYVTLKVYDVLGNEVATLVNENKPLGTYEINWYAEGLPSGIYFYQLKASSFVETKKMILLK